VALFPGNSGRQTGRVNSHAAGAGPCRVTAPLEGDAPLARVAVRGIVRKA
jgi:hypothetical protein